LRANFILERAGGLARCAKFLSLALLGCLFACGLVGESQARAQAASAPAARRAVLDRVVADADGQAILASDVDDEIRFSSLLPGAEPAADNTPQRALDRVIDRTLIYQQRALQPGVALISEKDVDQAIDTMRKQISAATNTDCETDAGWTAYLARYGFNPSEIQDRMRERLQILKFIDVRFGVVVQVSNADVRNYYDQVLMPELKQSKQPPPDYRTVAPKIRQILRQCRVSNMLDEWLKSLRAEGHVKILDPAYAEPSNQAESVAQGAIQ
jgi:peptidyl-prolyl cis-trans isomerase SurA